MLKNTELGESVYDDCRHAGGFQCRYRVNGMCKSTVVTSKGTVCRLLNDCRVCTHHGACYNEQHDPCKNDHDGMSQFTFDISDAMSYN